MPSLDVNRGAKRAREAREALGLDPAAPLACLLTAVEDDAGFPVIVGRLPGDVAGACVRTGDDGEGALLWVNGAEPVVRQRFTLAHELGHTWCGHDGTTSVDTVATLSGQTTDAREIQANSFAAEFLVPRAGIEQIIEGDPTLEELVTIGGHYGVSAWVVLFRCQTAGVVSAARGEKLRGEIEERLHLEAHRRLAVPDKQDRLAAITDLPYLSPALAGSALTAMLEGDASVDAAAGAAACDPAALQAAVEGLAAA